MLRFTVKTGGWWADGQEFPSGENEVSRPTKALIRLAAHAHSAGDIDVTEGLDESTVQTPEETQAALEEAMGEWQEAVYNDAGALITPGRWSGPWHEGNLLAQEETS